MRACLIEAKWVKSSFKSMVNELSSNKVRSVKDLIRWKDATAAFIS